MKKGEQQYNKAHGNQIPKTQQLILSQYDQAQESLCLFSCFRQWMDVMLDRNWSKLRQLQLDQCNIDDEQARVFCGMRWLELRSLSICMGAGQDRWQQVDCCRDEMFAHAGAAVFGTILDLYIFRQNQITIEKEMRVSNNWLELINYPKLRNLLLMKTTQLILEQAIQSLITHSLTSNFYNSTEIELAVKALKCWQKLISPYFNNSILVICRVHSGCCFFGDEGGKYLSKAIWPSLQDICFYDNRIEYDGYLNFVCGNRWKTVNQVSLAHSFTRTEPIAILNLFTADWLQNCKISYNITNTNIYKAVKTVLTHRFPTQ